MRAVASFVFLAVAACGGASTSTPPSQVVTSAHVHGHDPTSHNHSRGKMLMASDGTTTALLTAHLSSTDGNELDVFVERDGSPFALSVRSITGAAVGSDGQPRPVTFECAPANERPSTERDDACSHFVARTPWMRPDDVLRVEADLAIEGERAPFLWRNFGPRRYAHHEE